jgi:hypothetical protein
MLCGSIIPNLVYITGEGADANKRECYQFKGKSGKYEPVLLGEKQGLILESMVTLNDKAYFISASFWAREVNKLGVFSAARWQEVGRFVLHSLRALVAVSLSKEDTLGSDAYGKSLEEGASHVGLAGNGVFLDIDYHGTFSSAGLLVSRDFALMTLARYHFKRTPAGMKPGSVIPDEVPFDRLPEDTDDKFATDVGSKHCAAVKAQAPEVATLKCFLVNEYVGETAQIANNIWDFYCVPAGSAVDSAVHGFGNKEFLEYFDYMTQNNKPNPIPANEEFIKNQYLYDDKTTRTNLNGMYFFAVKKIIA